MRMRGAVVVVGSVLLVGALSGSAAAESPAVVGRYSTPESTAVMPASIKDAAYLATIRTLSRGTKIDAMADADVTALGALFCDGIDNGATSADLAKAGSLMDIPSHTWRSIVDVSEAYYCPGNIGV